MIAVKKFELLQAFSEMEPRSTSERLTTYENWHFKEPSPEQLSEAGFVWSPNWGRHTSPRLSCDGCPVLVWLRAEKEHPGYWHLPRCEFSTSPIELSKQGWKKPAYWEIYDEPMGYDGISTDFPPFEGELYRALEQEGEERQAQELLDEARSGWTYQYKPLNKKKKEIRVMILPKRYLNEIFEFERADGTIVKRTITPAQDNMQLVGLIRYYCLDDLPPEASFEALSYTWGPSEPSHPLFIFEGEVDIDGQPAEIRISSNLNSALRHLVVEDDEKKLEEDPMLYLWVDAICIDQRNNEEKAWQVELMYEIYRRAARVIVWLGPGDKSSNLAMEVLMGMRRVSQALKPFRENAHAEGFPESVVDMRQIPESAVEKLHKDDLELAAAFGLMFNQQVSGREWIRPFPIDDVAALFERSYWSRIWIWQEVAAAEDIVIVCGMKKVNDECFRTFMTTWDSQMSEMVLPPRGIDHRPWAVIMTRQELRAGAEIRKALADPDVDEETKVQMRDFLAEPENRIYSRTLRMLLQEAWKAQLEATNPLDHIYAVLNLASDREDLGIEVDYTVSPVELYTKVVRTLYEKGDLSLMAYCGGKQTNLPSWVPNFTGERGWIPIRELCGHAWRGTSAFDASNGTQCVISFEEPSSKVLEISGILVDTVTFVDVRRANVGINDVTPENRRHMVHWLRQAFDYLSDVECEAYPTAEARKEAVWKTPILDHFRLGNGTERAGPEAKKGYYALLGKKLETEAPESKELGPQESDPQESEPQDREPQEPKPLEPKPQDPEAERLENIYFFQMIGASNGTKPLRTKKGYIGLGPASAEEGDVVAVLLGCEVPFMLRKEEDGKYRLIGEAYIHGIMFGELFAHDPKIDTFPLC